MVDIPQPPQDGPEIAQGPPEGARWPAGSRLLQLRPKSKVPYGGAQGNAHLGAVVDAEFIATGANVGIVLDGAYILVDIDAPGDPVAKRWTQELDGLGTWQQATPRQHATAEQRAEAPVGRHWLVAAPPDLLATAINGKIVGDDGRTIIGDIKVRGYCLAPGSAIECDDGVTRSYTALSSATQTPVAAPEWLTTYINQRPWVGLGRHQSTASGAAEAGNTLGIPTGTHDDFLASLGGFLRGRWGLAGAALEQGIAQGLPLLQDSDPTRPYTKSDIERIARSCANLEAGTPVPTDAGGLAPENWINGSMLSLVTAPVEWWIRHFVPKGELVMLYGRGGSGKSSWGSWLASEVTQAGGSFAFFGVEEPFRRFLWRAVLNGADRDKVWSPTDAGRIRLPRDADALKRAITMSNVEVVYFDSIMSHFQHMQGLNIAERARACLAPLAEIAQATGVTIVCVFHENRQGEFMGSAEMENVGRYVLRAARSKTGPLRISVGKTNLVMPDYALTYNGRKATAVDPLTGETQYEKLEDGSLQAYEFTVCDYAGQVNDDGAPEEMPKNVETDEMTAPVEKKRSKAKVKSV